MISIITRCYNRLEYTIQVVNAVRDLGGDYEHIIIDNGSQDGTPEWFRWMNDNTSWYNNIKYYRFDNNIGDWKGMVKGFIHSEGDYIMQLDNDIIPQCKSWLADMVRVLEETKYRTVMLRRANVAWKLKPKGPVFIVRNESIDAIDDLEVAPVERPVACFMADRKTFKMLSEKVVRSDRSKYEIRALVGNTAKILNRTCIEIEADFQRDKYNPKNKNIWAKL